MIKLDNTLLAELGLDSLPEEEKIKLLRHIYETLEKRVGTTLAMQMTEEQLKEFEQFIEAENEAGALQWLETNFPNYRDVVANEFEIIKNEVRQARPQILASASQATMQPQVQQYAPQPGAGYGQQPYPQPTQPMQGYQQPVAPQSYAYQAAPPQQPYPPQQPATYAMPPQQPMGSPTGYPPQPQPFMQQPTPPPTYSNPPQPTTYSEPQNTTAVPTTPPSSVGADGSQPYPPQQPAQSQSYQAPQSMSSQSTQTDLDQAA